jgi:hypothetical protein
VEEGVKARTARSIQKDAQLEMAAFDALPPELRDFIRTANQGWACSKLRMRLMKAGTKKGGWWGTERLLAQYRTEDAMPAEIGR